MPVTCLAYVNKLNGKEIVLMVIGDAMTSTNQIIGHQYIDVCLVSNL